MLNMFDFSELLAGSSLAPDSSSFSCQYGSTVMASAHLRPGWVDFSVHQCDLSAKNAELCSWCSGHGEISRRAMYDPRDMWCPVEAALEVSDVEITTDEEVTAHWSWGLPCGDSHALAVDHLLLVTWSNGSQFRTVPCWNLPWKLVQRWKRASCLTIRIMNMKCFWKCSVH